MEVICLEEKAFEKLIDHVTNLVKSKNEIEKSSWIDKDEAMNLLKLKSSTSLQTLRDKNLIRFTSIGSKNILYDYKSILDYMDKKANK